MHETDLQALVTLYALDLLEEPDRGHLRAELDQIPEIGAGNLAASLQQESTLAALIGYGVEPLDLDPALKQRIWHRLAQDPTPPAILSAHRAQDWIWQPHPVSGVEIVLLNLDQPNTELTCLFRADGPTDYPHHQHLGPEEILVLRGDLQVGDLDLGAGDFIRSEIGSQHPHATRQGCLCLVRSCPEDPFLESGSRMDPFRLLRDQDRVWQPYATAGVEVAVLHLDPDRRQVTGILKAQAGVSYPLHQHGGPEEIFMLAGDLIVESQVFGPGDYLRSPTGSAHAPITRLGCHFFYRTSIDDQFLDPTSL